MVESSEVCSQTISLIEAEPIGSPFLLTNPKPNSYLSLNLYVYMYVIYDKTLGWMLVVIVVAFLLLFLNRSWILLLEAMMKLRVLNWAVGGLFYWQGNPEISIPLLLLPFSTGDPSLCLINLNLSLFLIPLLLSGRKSSNRV